MGINYCWNCITIVSSDESVADAIFTMLVNGELQYLKPIWNPKFDPFGNLIDPYGDPNFYGTNGTNNPKTATHGINSTTHLIQTNQ